MSGSQGWAQLFKSVSFHFFNAEVWLGGAPGKVSPSHAKQLSAKHCGQTSSVWTIHHMVKASQLSMPHQGAYVIAGTSLQG